MKPYKLWLIQNWSEFDIDSYGKLWRGEGSYMSYESWGPENPYPSPNGQNMLCCVGIKSTNGLSC